MVLFMFLSLKAIGTTSVYADEIATVANATVISTISNADIADEDGEILDGEVFDDVTIEEGISDIESDNVATIATESSSIEEISKEISDEKKSSSLIILPVAPTPVPATPDDAEEIIPATPDDAEVVPATPSEPEKVETPSDATPDDAIPSKDVPATSSNADTDTEVVRRRSDSSTGSSSSVKTPVEVVIPRGSQQVDDDIPTSDTKLTTISGLPKMGEDTQSPFPLYCQILVLGEILLLASLWQLRRWC